MHFNNFQFFKVLALAILWILKSTDASIVFPLMVLALVLFRKSMDYFPKVFSQRDLFWLDNLMPSSGEKKDDDNEEEMEENKVWNFRVVNFWPRVSLRGPTIRQVVVLVVLVIGELFQNYFNNILRIPRILGILGNPWNPWKSLKFLGNPLKSLEILENLCNY